jgi:hypothetical protein
MMGHDCRIFTILNPATMFGFGAPFVWHVLFLSPTRAILLLVPQGYNGSVNGSTNKTEENVPNGLGCCRRLADEI